MTLPFPRILFFCFGRAGLECLNLLVNQPGANFNSIRVMTYDMPDCEKIIALAQNFGIQVSTFPISSEAGLRIAQQFAPEMLISIYYRHRIPNMLLQTAERGSFNLHPSLLPKYKGCFSGVWAIINQEKYTGISYHRMTADFDEGAILLQKQLKIDPNETGFTIYNRLIDLGVSHFLEAFQLSLLPTYIGSPQQGSSSYYGRKVPFDGIIDPSWEHDKVDSFIRALNFPGRKGASVKTNDGLIEVRSFAEYEALKLSGAILKPNIAPKDRP